MPVHGLSLISKSKRNFQYGASSFHIDLVKTCAEYVQLCQGMPPSPLDFHFWHILDSAGKSASYRQSVVTVQLAHIPAWRSQERMTYSKASYRLLAMLHIEGPRISPMGLYR